MYLTDRQEIAKAMNFWKYPVLRINMEKPDRGYDGYFVGDKVEVITPSEKYPGSRERGNLYFCDGKFAISSEGACLHADFGYSDVIENLEWAQAPKLKAGQTVVIIEDWPNAKRCRVHMMQLPERIDKFTTPCCTLEEIEEG